MHNPVYSTCYIIILQYSHHFLYARFISNVFPAGISCALPVKVAVLAGENVEVFRCQVLGCVMRSCCSFTIVKYRSSVVVVVILAAQRRGNCTVW